MRVISVRATRADSVPTTASALTCYLNDGPYDPLDGWKIVPMRKEAAWGDLVTRHAGNVVDEGSESDSLYKHSCGYLTEE